MWRQTRYEADSVEFAAHVTQNLRNHQANFIGYTQKKDMLIRCHRIRFAETIHARVNHEGTKRELRHQKKRRTSPSFSEKIGLKRLQLQRNYIL